MRAALDVAEQVPPGRELIYRQARQAVHAQTHGHYPAPLRALEAVAIGFEQGMAAGLEAEAKALGELAVTPTAKNLIWLFLASQRARRPSPAATRHPLPLREGRGEGLMGVVGAGFMGAAIAEVGAAAGLPVRIRDVSPEAVARGLATIRKLVDEGVARRRFEPHEGREILRRVSGGPDYAGFARADLVIEAVFEDLSVKRKVVSELDAVLSNDAVIATNTSALPISEIAREAKRPERIVGMHFFSPAQRMPLLEVVRAAGSADWAVEKAVSLGAKMGKTVIVVADSPGFYTSRVLGALMNEAAVLVGEGARLEDVDRALTEFGFPVGPFVLYDEVGLEVAQHAGETVAHAFGDRTPQATIVADLVARGDTGRKAGRGFYIWPRAPQLPALAQRLLPQPRRAANPVVYGGAPRKGMPESEIQDRLVLLFVNEAIRCLDEGVLQSPTDGDLGAVLGLGFPPFLGGPFHYADSLGAQVLTARLRTLADRHGRRYEPAASLALKSPRRFFEEQV
jgi:3-hydroxyacyl-CoA dehydrogenase/enoyl-CoA hydratase/3-hydroxybutyryl-CoA epimerase